LLLPEDFGIIGMITIVIAVSNSIIDSGFGNALIREKNVTQKEYSTVFYFNLVISILIYIMLFFAAQIISSFFDEKRLIAILRILSLSLIVNSFGLVQRTILTKKIDFKIQTKINVVASILSGIAGVGAAFIGLGVWSLVIRTLIMSLLQSILLFMYNKWIPSLEFDIKSFKKFFRFGWKLLLSGLINTLYSNLYFLIIGKGFSTIELGYYTNASKLKDTATQSITSSIQKVSYPVLSNINNKEGNLKTSYKKILKNAAFIIFPIIIGLAAIAKPLIILLFGEKWSNSIIYFQILCFEGMLYPIHAINLNAMQVKGRSDLFLKVEIIKKAISIIIIGIVLILRLGIISLLWGAVLNSYISYFINVYYTKTLINYAVHEQIIDIMPSCITSGIMGAIVYLIGIILPFNKILIIIIQLIMGVISYILLNKIIKSGELSNIENLLKNLLNRTK
jgi:O-antigen/teichoic acid export membrane protein